MVNVSVVVYFERRKQSKPDSIIFTRSAHRICSEATYRPTNELRSTYFAQRYSLLQWFSIFQVDKDSEHGESSYNAVRAINSSRHFNV